MGPYLDIADVSLLSRDISISLDVACRSFGNQMVFSLTGGRIWWLGQVTLTASTSHGSQSYSFTRHKYPLPCFMASTARSPTKILVSEVSLKILSASALSDIAWPVCSSQVFLDKGPFRFPAGHFLFDAVKPVAIQSYPWQVRCAPGAARQAAAK